LDWSTTIITGAAEEPLGLGILGQQRSELRGEGGGGLGGLSVWSAGRRPPSVIHSKWSSAAQTQVTQESRQRQHDRQKVGAGRDSVEAYDYLCIGVVELAELMQGGEAWRCGLV
jgi:hypothetical protein